MASAPRTFDVAAFLDGRGLSAFNYRVIMLSWFITLFDGLDLMMISFTAPYLKDSLALTKPMLGNLFAAGTAGQILGGFLFCYIADRIGRRPTVIGTSFLFGVLTIATAFAHNYPQLMVLRFVDGLAIGGMLPIAWALNIEFVPRRMRATIVTVIMLGYSIGSSGAGPVTNWIAPHHGWQGVYIAGGIGTLICAILLLIGLPESIRFLTSKGRAAQVATSLRKLEPDIVLTGDEHFILGDEAKVDRGFHVRELFRGDLGIITPLLWVGYMASALAIFGNSSWGPSLLEELAVPRHTAALISSTGGLLGAIAGLVLMRLTERRGPRWIAFYPALAVPVLLILGLGLAPVGGFLPFVVVGNALLGGGHAAIISIAGVYYPSAIRANGGGWATSIAKFGGVIGPIIGGWMLASGMPVLRAYAFLAICPAILCLAVLGIAATLHRRRVFQPDATVAPAL
ncbi:MFS transporter [Sphingomonas sp. MMS24-J13]|uniref:MFS transporter n=1 Tax=Sphingomonas sp. MMS24-J13 TaxID=3238686 RepID=UPI00384A4A2E